MKQKKQTLIAVAAAIMLGAGGASASVALTSASPVVAEDFNSMWDGSAGTLTLPEGWRVDRNLEAPRRVGSWEQASTEVMYAGGVSLASNAKNGTWNFGPDSNDRAIGGLTTTVSNGTRGVSLMTALPNQDAAKVITHLNLSYNVEKYRKGSNAAGFRVQLYTSDDGEKWTAAGEDFLTSFDPDSETAGASVVPISSTAVNDRQLRVHVEPGKTLYLAWNISVTSGSSPDKAPGLAVDDVVINATFADSDPDWQDPETPEINHSGIYMRGVDGWDATDEWEFNRLSDTTFELRDKLVSGSFKIGDANWSASCNYGSNGQSIMMSEPYVMTPGTDSGDISCGGITFNCSRILLTIENGTATLLLEPNESMEGLSAIYMVGDFNGWNYMDKGGELVAEAAGSNTFSGQVTMKSGSDGLSHWRLYQRLGMAGVWGLDADATSVSPLSGSLKKGAKGNLATAPGTYAVTVTLNENGTGTYSLSAVESVATEMTVNPAETVLVTEVPETVRVLSLNNSLIHYNDQSKMFNDIAAAMGKNAQWTKHTLLGKSLATHWEEGDGLAGDGQPGAKMMVRSQPWSHIILQEQSSLPRTNIATFRANVERWVNYIRENCPNPNAVIIMPVNWAYSGDWSNFTQFNDIFLANYREVADEFGLVLCPVMNAYQAIYDEKGAEGLAPWFQDDRHPTDLSTYMAACMEYGLIFGEDPTAINQHPEAVSEADAADMRSRAAAVLNAFTQTVNHHAATVALNVKVKDAFGLELPAQNLSYTVDNPDAAVSSEGVFHATEPGDYVVTVKASGFEKTAKIKVARAVTEMPYNPSISVDAEDPELTEDFNTLGEAAEASLPEGWRIDRTDSPRAVGTFADALEHTTYAGGVNLLSNAKNGVWNFGPDAEDRAVGGITTGVAGGTRAVNVYAHLVNDGLKKITSIDMAYDIEKYRDGNNAAGFRVQLFTSADGRNWTEAPSDFLTTFPASTATAGAAVVPIETKSVDAVLPVELGAGCDLYLAWNISVASGNECQGAPALALDNVRMTMVPQPVPEYDWHIYIQDETGYASMGVYAYGDKEIWGAWPGQAPIDFKNIDGVTYKVFGHDEGSGNYSLIVNNYNQGSQLPDKAIKGGRDYWFRATPTQLVEISPSGVEEMDAAAEARIVVKGSEVECAGAEKIMVCTLTGAVAAAASAESIAIDSLPSGVYIAHATGGSFRTSVSFVKK